METSIQLYDKVPNALEAIHSLGKSISESALFGAALPGQGVVIAWTCFSEKITPVQFTEKYHIIQNRLSKKSDWLLGELRRRGGKHVILKRDSECASIRITFDGQTQEFTLTHDQVKQEPFYFDKNGKPKGLYATPFLRTKMLWARVVSDAVSCLAPEIGAGNDIDDTVDTPAPSLTLLPPSAAPISPPIAAASSPANAAASKTVEVQSIIVPVDSGNTPPQLPPPIKTDAGQIAPEAPQAQSAGTLSKVDKLRKLEELCAGKEEQAMKWFIARGNLKPGQSLADIPESWLDKYLAHSEVFVKRIMEVSNA